MDSDELLTGVQEVFRDVFDEPTLTITRQSSAETVEDWDSLTHVNLVMAIERRYKVKFGLGELQQLKDVGDLLDLLAQKLGAR
jgi:acyl carrier protein